MTLKLKELIILPAKCVYLGIAENCNSGQPYYSKIYIKLIPAELFQILNDDAMKVLQSIWQQIWKTQQWPQDWKGTQDWKGQFSFQSQRKAV